MTALLTDIDPNGLLEYSVVYTDRSLNHMSPSFQSVMRDISETLKEVYHAHAVAVVPGSGTFAMEAVARQFATEKKCLVIRNGWFSYRWTQIFDMGKIPSQSVVMKAHKFDQSDQPYFTPAPIDQVVEQIHSQKPDIVFAPHVETSSGMILPDDYLKKVASATRAVGGLFVLDCIASGTIWVDMKEVGVDVLISAPQKGWSGSPCCGLVMLSERANVLLEKNTSSSFACDLKKWRQIMSAYENGGHAYHATMPTDALTKFCAVMNETKQMGWQEVKSRQNELGQRIRSLLVKEGFKSVAAPGFQAPGVVVSYTDDPEIKSGKKFITAGLQIAAGVPLQCDEPANFQTFRVGLFGLDKLNNVDRTVDFFREALTKII
ncbi:MAG: alanine--glyoxylate aminotransferase family protein [Saprospiraceae bacterium]|nr:alanine--glyoxylate aminotransferase family protein [Saprospiraceae bacterium]